METQQSLHFFHPYNRLLLLFFFVVVVVFYYESGEILFPRTTETLFKARSKDFICHQANT